MRGDMLAVIVRDSVRSSTTNLALPLSDRQRIRDLEYNAPAFFVPDETSCVWLGPPGKEAPPKFMRPGGPPVMHSLSPTEFTPLDRGPPITGTMPTPPFEPLAVGQRATPPEDDEP